MKILGESFNERSCAREVQAENDGLRAVDRRPLGSSSRSADIRVRTRLVPYRFCLADGHPKLLGARLACLNERADCQEYVIPKFRHANHGGTEYRDRPGLCAERSKLRLSRRFRVARAAKSQRTRRPKSTVPLQITGRNKQDRRLLARNVASPN